jgi:hypothetical protein
MRVNVTNHLDDLTNDLAAIPRRVPRMATDIVRDGARYGNLLAKGYAKESAGKHGKHYPNAFTSEVRRGFFGFGGGVYAAEYGPESGRPQGDMSFERGSRNQSPHNDLAKSADIVGPLLPGQVSNMLRDLFW